MLREYTNKKIQYQQLTALTLEELQKGANELYRLTVEERKEKKRVARIKQDVHRKANNQRKQHNQKRETNSLMKHLGK